MGLEITLPTDEQIKSWFIPLKEKAIPATQETLDKTYAIITDKALFDNEDKNGNPMPYKKDTSKYPDQLIETGLMKDRQLWELGAVDDESVTINYKTSEIIDKWGRSYMDYLLTKDPQEGGRPWIDEDKINAEAVEELKEMIAENLLGETYDET